jgi:hypothetical protein
VVIARALVAIAVAGGVARADVIIARDPPPPPPPPPAPAPAPTYTFPSGLGWRLGMGSFPLADNTRFAASFGLAWSRSIAGARIGLDYEWLLLAGEEMEARATGHRALATLRANVADRPGRLRYYLDADVGAGAAYVADPALGERIVPTAMFGIRGGYELAAEGRSPSRAFDFHVALRAYPSTEGIGVLFSIGMEWLGR